jgi:hypothetical protein
MDCKTARLLLDFHRPRCGELPPEEAVELERHLAGCADCDAAGRTLRRLDDHLGAAVRAVPLPDGLRERLLGRLREERGTRLHRRMAWAGRGLAVAAALLIATLLWLHFRAPSPPPKLDVNGVAEAELRQHRPLSGEGVEAWFKEKYQVTMVAPPVLNYNYLIDYDLSHLQGKPVPRLSFHHEQGDNAATRATVYVVTSDQFDLGALNAIDPQQYESFGLHLEIWPPQPQRPTTAYVIFFDGDNLDLLTDGAPRPR